MADNLEKQKLNTLVKKITEIKKDNPESSNTQIKEKMKNLAPDDELDLAIILAQTNPEPQWVKTFYKIQKIAFIIIGIVFVLSFLLPNIIGLILQLIPNINQFYVNFVPLLAFPLIIPIAPFAFPLAFASIIIYLLYGLKRQQQIFSIIALDFNGKIIEKPSENNHIAKISKNSYFLPNNTFFTHVIQTKYDEKTTIFGEYQWSEGAGDNKTTYLRSFIIQELVDKNFANTIIIPHAEISILSNFAGQDIQLESEDFNKIFAVKSTGKPKSAFYTLNPRVMSQILDEYKNNQFCGLIIEKDYLFISYNSKTDTINTIFNQDNLTPSAYKTIKNTIITELNSCSKISDTLLKNSISTPEIQ